MDKMFHASQYEEVAEFLKIIGDRNRWQILKLLSDGERCVCEIFPHLGLAQNLVSSHLKILLNSNLISLRQEGKRNYYSLNAQTLKKQSSKLILLLRQYE